MEYAIASDLVIPLFFSSPFKRSDSPNIAEQMPMILETPPEEIRVSLHPVRYFLRQTQQTETTHH